MTNGFTKTSGVVFLAIYVSLITACVSGDNEAVSSDVQPIVPVDVEPGPEAQPSSPANPSIPEDAPSPQDPPTPDDPPAPQSPTTPDEPGMPETPVTPTTPATPTDPPVSPSNLSLVLPNPRPRNAYEKLSLRRLQLGGIAKEYVLVKFSTVFGQLNDIETIEPDESLPVDGTGALYFIERFWDELSSAEQTQIARYVLPPDVVELPLSNSGVLDSTEILTMASDHSARFEVLTNTTLINPISFFEVMDSDAMSKTNSAIYSVPTEIGQKMMATLAQSSSVFDNAEMSQCNIFITSKFAEFSVEKKTTVLAHEIFHCFQSHWMDHDLSRIVQSPEWVAEGTAAWAGEFIAGGSGTLDSWWDIYEVNGFKILRSAHDAIGFWSFIAEHIDLWPTIPSVIQKDGAFGNRFRYVTGFLTDETIDSWPSGPVQRAEWGTEWTAEASGYTPIRNPRVFSLTSDDEPFSLRVAQGEIGTFELELDAPESAILFSVQASAAGNRHWDKGGPTTSLVSTSELPSGFCINGPCVCNDGNEPAGFADIQTIPGDSRRLTVAMTKSPRTLEGSFTADLVSMSEACAN